MKFFDRVDAAKTACYFRLHPRPWIDKSPGARLLYDAVCDLWVHAGREVVPATRPGCSAVMVACETRDGLLNIHPETEMCNVCGAPVLTDGEV